MEAQGLYLPEFEHDNCGAGFICNLNGIKSNDIIHKALDILIKLEHRGAIGSDGRTGDGAGIAVAAGLSKSELDGGGVNVFELSGTAAG